MALGAPAAPEVGLTFGLILLGIACVLLLALNKAWEYTLGALLGTFANMVGSLPKVRILGHDVPPWDALASGINDLDNYVLQAIGYGIARTEAGMHAIVSWMVWVLQATADEVAGLAEDTLKGFNYVKGYLIPAMLGVALAPIIRQLTHLAGQTKTIVLHPTTIVRATTRVVAPGLKALEGKVSQLEGKVAALATAGVAANPVPIIERIGSAAPAIPSDIYRGIDSLWKESKRIAKVLTPAGIVGLVGAAVLSQFELGWLRCKGVGRVGKGLCGLSGLIETLFSDALDALVVADLCQFTSALAYATREFEPVLIAFVDVENALIGCHGATLPPALGVESLDLPPVTGYVLA